MTLQVKLLRMGVGLGRIATTILSDFSLLSVGFLIWLESMLNPLQFNPLVEAAVGKYAAGQKTIRPHTLYNKAQKLKKEWQCRTRNSALCCKVETEA
jgi:hypothetical protein